MCIPKNFWPRWLRCLRCRAYRYFDAQDALLYVGKALNLAPGIELLPEEPWRHAHWPHGQQDRAHGDHGGAPEAEALLLENNLIKTLNPKFNILFRDDKSYPTSRSPARRPLARRARPGLSAHGVLPWAVDKSTATLARTQRLGGEGEHSASAKVFRLRTCEDTVFANRTRPCLLYQIKRCTGPWRGPDFARGLRGRRAACRGLAAGETQEPLQALEVRMMAHPTSSNLSRRPRCATRSRRCRACCTSKPLKRWTTRCGHPRRARARRARLRQSGHGARWPPPG